MLSRHVKRHAEEVGRVFRFLLAGGANTLLGFGLIVLFMEVLGWSPYASNLSAYGITFLTSYALHRAVTFRSSGDPKSELLRFAAIYAGSFVVNFVALAGFVVVLPALAAQVAASAVFVAASYGGQRLYVFSRGIKGPR